MSGIETEAAQLIAVHGRHAVQKAVDGVVAAVRSGDDAATTRADRVLRSVEHQLREKNRLRSYAEPVVCVPFTLLDLTRPHARRARGRAG